MPNFTTEAGGGRIYFLIVVGVVLELIRRVDTELKGYDYKRFYYSHASRMEFLHKEVLTGMLSAWKIQKESYSEKIR